MFKNLELNHERAAVPRQGAAVVTLGIVTIAIVGLYVGQDFLIPFAIAILLSFALGPVAIRLRRWGFGRVPSVLIVVLAALVAMAGLGILIGSQIVQLVRNLPTYQSNIHAKIRSVQTTAPGGGMIDRAATVLRELSNDISGEPAAESKGAARPDGRNPIPVRIEEPSPSMLQIAASIASPLLGPIGSAGLVIVFLFLMLLEREDLRSRLIKLVGGGNLYLTTEALDDAAKRISRYLLMQLIVNVTYGLPLGLGLYLIGVPNALLWGLLATVLRFLPYVGPFLAALFPTALAIAVDPGWSMLLWTVALFLTLELVSNNVIEPWLYGSSTGVSAIAIILAAIVWTTLWGPIGLLLSTPLTVCLAVMGRHIPQLRFLDVLLGSEPVLSAQEQLYQRMLAGDSEEGEEIVKAQLKGRTLPELHDQLILPALRMAESDRKRKFLGGERRALVTESFLRVIASLPEDESVEISGDGSHTPEQAAARSEILWSGKCVLCLAGRTGLDRVAAAMLAQRLERYGIGTRLLPADAISSDSGTGLNTSGIELISLVYLGQGSANQARHVSLRLRRQAPGAKILLVLLSGDTTETGEKDSSTAPYADFIAVSLAEASDQVRTVATAPIEGPMMPPPLPPDEAERLAELRKLKILDTEPEETFDQITRRLAEAFSAPIALLTLVDEYRQFWKSATGLPEDLALARQAPKRTSICGHVVATKEVLVIEDTLKDKRFANNPFLRERGIRFYAGAPLCTSSGRAIGSLCVLDTEPRTISGRERTLLQLIADEVTAKIEKRAPSAAGAPLPEQTGCSLDSGYSP